MLYKSYYNSHLGEMLIVSDNEKLIGVWIKDQKYYLDKIKEEIILKNDLDIIQKTIDWLNRYFNGEKPTIHELQLAPRGSNFRQIVWNILCQIPYGETRTYGYIAKKVAKIMNKEKMSAQAVGNAVGHNPISIIIPCHRVVGENGSLTGYAGGIENKIKLLRIENVNMENLYVPRKGSTLYSYNNRILL